LRSKSVDGAQKGSAARNVTETKFIWKNRKLKRPYKRSFLIQMALAQTNTKNIIQYSCAVSFQVFGLFCSTWLTHPASNFGVVPEK
jgi:hypothetical protein